MEIRKNGYGSAKHKADLVKVSLQVFTTRKEKDGLLEDYLKDYDYFSSNMKSFLQENNVNSELYFDSYVASESKKQIVEEKEGKKETNYVTDFYYIEGSFHIDIKIDDNNIISKLIQYIDELNKSVKIYFNISYTLQEETEAKVRAEATNNAIDNIIIEMNKIKEHLNVENVILQSIDFTNSSGIYNNLDCSKARIGGLSEEEQIKILDDMLNQKDIEISSSFVSTWLLE